MGTNMTNRQQSVGRRRWRWVVAVGLVLTACGTPSADTPASPSPVTDVSPAPAGDAADAAGGTMLAGQNLDEAIVQQAQQRLAQHLNVSPDTVILESGSVQEWPDSAMGCPAPDQMYTQAVTSGYQLVFFANDEPQDVRITADGSEAVMCDNDAPVPLPSAE